MRIAVFGAVASMVASQCAATSFSQSEHFTILAQLSAGKCKPPKSAMRTALTPKEEHEKNCPDMDKKKQMSLKQAQKEAEKSKAALKKAEMKKFNTIYDKLNHDTIEAVKTLESLGGVKLPEQKCCCTGTPIGDTLLAIA